MLSRSFVMLQDVSEFIKDASRLLTNTVRLGNYAWDAEIPLSSGLQK